MDTIPPDRYTVFVQFTVDENGKLSNVSILKEPGYGLGDRVKKLILNCYGIWKSVIDDRSRVVAIYRKQLITFIFE
jgi:protein TonB